MNHTATLPTAAAHAVDGDTFFASAKRMLAGLGCAVRFAGLCAAEHRRGGKIDAARASAIFSRAAAATGVRV